MTPAVEIKDRNNHSAVHVTSPRFETDLTERSTSAKPKHLADVEQAFI
jgi:hypothetical protein